MQVLKRLLVFVLCVIIAAFPLSVFADRLPAVDLSNVPLRTAASGYYEQFYDEQGNTYLVSDRDYDTASYASVEVYDKDSISISGYSDINTWASFRMRFGRKNASSGQIPLSYDDYFYLGASFFTDSYVDWGLDLAYGITLDMKGEVYYVPEYFYNYNHDDGSSFVLPDSVYELSPHSYDGKSYFYGEVSPFKGLDSAVPLDYSSSSHSWSYWLGADSCSEGSFSSDSSSPFYYSNYAAVIDASDTIVSLNWDMGDNNSDFGAFLISDDTVNFTDVYSNAVASGMEEFSFGLTLDDYSLSYLDEAVRFACNSKAWEGGSFQGVQNTGNYTRPNDLRYYDTPLDVDHFSWSKPKYGVFYSLIPVDGSGNELTNYIIGPYMFNTGIPISDLLDLNYDYKVRLEVYISDVDLTLKGFSVPHSSVWQSEMIPYNLASASSSATTSFGADLDFCFQLALTSGFVVTPTIYADGVSNSDILNNFNSNFENLTGLLTSGFTSVNNSIASSTSQITSSVSSAAASVNSTISSSTASINNQLVDSTNKINQKIEDTTDEITNGYDSSDMDKAQQDFDTALKDLDGVEDSEITDPDGNKTSFFDYIKSVFSSWSWPSFTTEFTNALKEISTIINSIYNSLPEAFQTLIMFLILFTVLAIVLNLYKYYNSG